MMEKWKGQHSNLFCSGKNRLFHFPNVLAKMTNVINVASTM
jgi:hypothetical protein